jgi:hypothetical protein
MKKLLVESDFITVNLSDYFKSPNTDIENDNKEKATDNETDSTVDTETETEIETAVDELSSAKISDWGAELKKRLADNRSREVSKRENEFKVEDKFFRDYFSSNWDSDIAKQLILMGEPLKKLFKVLGFSKLTNPILAFLKDKFVLNRLVKPGLLNANTFKALYEALAKKYTADSEFLKANNYNIIYCPALYKKPLTDMIEYLKLQGNVLQITNGNKYTKATIDKNKKVFLAIPGSTGAQSLPVKKKQIMETDVTDISVQNSALNDLALAVELSGVKLSNNKTELRTHIAVKEMEELVRKLNTHAKRLAAIQYLSITTKSKKAKNALKHEKFGGVSLDNLLQATADIESIMPKQLLFEKDADALVDALMSGL